MNEQATPDWLDQVAWNDQGLVTAVAQDVETGEVLMLAWMNREALEETLRRGIAVYWSRSRRRLWPKGERSGHVQEIEEIRLDCDGDALLLKVRQRGGIACHTGRRSCFHRRLDPAGPAWQSDTPVLKDPKEIYP